MAEFGGSIRVGDWVRFSISDVFLPEPAEVLADLTSDLRAEGLVMDFSDSGSSPRVFAVVRITPMQLVLLPVSALRVLNSE
jgi:hypothetical protein